MKSRFCYCLILLLLTLRLPLAAQDIVPIKLLPPDTSRGLNFMQTLAVKASATEWADKELSLRDLSDLLWAANGMNRPEENKTTASSALNAHDVDIYLFRKCGVYVYDFVKHELTPVLHGDYCNEILARRAEFEPPMQILLISDIDRIWLGSQAEKLTSGAMDTGIISQNISLFCAATGLKTGRVHQWIRIN